MKIGNLTIEKTAALAPMAGVADGAFRALCREMGAAMTVSEMVSSKGLIMGDQNSRGLLETTDCERPMGVQLFGEDPVCMAQATEKSLLFHPNFIDINMGCPVPKITGNGAGSALMLNLPRARAIISEVVAASSGVPVTVKMRKGWDDEHVTCVELAKIAQDCGVAVVTIHGRTRKQMYAPGVDLDIIRKVKEAVAIPVIGNGDVDSAEKCCEMYEKTGCDLVMIGRGALGNPFLFREIRSLLEDGRRLPPPTIEERMQVMTRQAELTCRYKGERTAMKEMRKHAAWYMKGLRGAAAFRSDAGKLNTFEDIRTLAQSVLQDNR